jgi:hypothetical protein
MTSGVAAAVITAAVSLVLTLGKIVWDAHEKRQERRLAAREKLDKYRAPLLAAVDDLGRCIDNIRNDNFLAYLDTDDRRNTALHSTLFRLAQYFGWVEIIHGYSDRLRFESDEATRAVTGILGDIGRILATDEFDRTSEDDFTTSQLMLWRDEQRAVGELMRQDGDEPRCISFDSFVDGYDKSFAKWFATFARDIESASASDSARLAQLHLVLINLVRELDVDKVLVQVDQTGELIKPPWTLRSHVAKPSNDAATSQLADDLDATS